MKNLPFVLLFVISICLISWQSSWNSKATIEEIDRNELNDFVVGEMNIIIELLEGSLGQLNDKEKLVTAYQKSRKSYKKIEFFIEHVSPIEAKYFINGALVPKYSEEGEERVIYPHGFQKIEELLWEDQIDGSTLKEEIELLIRKLLKLKDYYQTIDIDKSVWLEMCQLQLFRIAALNLNGYDATITKSNIPEVSWSFEGIIVTLDHIASLFKDNPNVQEKHSIAVENIRIAQLYLKKNSDYDSFNRLFFITRHLNEINKNIVDFHNSTGLTWTESKKSLKLNFGSLFSEESFNLQSFSIYYDDTLNIKSQAELGKILFYDPILSSNNKRACSSCHNPNKGFGDGLEKSASFDGISKLNRNTPSLLNVIFQKAFFHDGRVYQLEQQAFDVIHNKEEMGGNLEDAVRKLRKSKEYRHLFSVAFANTADSSISAYSIQKAISEYEKTLVSMSSRFDQYLKGNYKTLSKDEVAGYNVFAGKGLCGSCHFFPLFNGTVPPYFMENEFEIIGTAISKANKMLDPDQGRYHVTNVKEHKNAFKTPTVRNAEITGPYMHNGAYSTLEEVIDFYHKGGGKGFKYEVENQTLPFDSLMISNKEKKQMILFLKALTDTSSVKQQKFILPAFENEASWNKRQWGGEY